jgi:hypothetical protein
MIDILKAMVENDLVDLVGRVMLLLKPTVEDPSPELDNSPFFHYKGD